jgi:hypothetical protein
MRAPLQHHGVAARLERFISPLAREFQWRGLQLLVAGAVILRLILMAAYFPAVMLSYDAPRYARVDLPMFGDFWMPAGYPLLLRLIRLLSHQLWWTIAVQHLLGVTAGVLLFLAARQLRLRRGAAAAVAAVPLFCGDHLYLEHQIMADSSLIFWTSLGLAAATRAFALRNGARWLAIASLALAIAGLTRSVAVFLLPVIVLCTAIAQWRHWKPIAAALLPGAGVYCTYIAVVQMSHGQYLGLSDMRGWNLYSRVAPFADCREFTPPEGTQVLCESRGPAARPGPFGYVWDLTSTPRKSFALGPETGGPLEAFAMQAITHQPAAYVRAVAVDLARYFIPSLSSRPYAGQPPEILSFGWRDCQLEQLVVRAMAKRYRGATVHIVGQRWLALYQRLARPGGIFLGALLGLTIAGAWRARNTLRTVIVLFGLTAGILYGVPVLTVSYDFRYGIPAETFLAVSGVLGAAALWPRRLQEGSAS